jgi:hypothetical protein
MLSHVIGIDQDVVQVYKDTNIEEVGEDVVHETLKSSQSIGKAERHNTILKGSITGSEGSFPFITFGDSDKMECMPKIDFGIDACFPRCIEEIGNEWKWVSILFGNLVKTTVIDTKSETAILFS